MGTIEIEVVKWEQYNPRTDRKKHSWFRLENSIATESKFFGLSAAQKFVAICLFAEVSKHSGAPAKINVAWLADQLKIKPSEILETIQHLVKEGVVRLPNGSESGLPAVTDRHTTNERTIRTNERTNDTVCTVAKTAPAPTEVLSAEDLISILSEKVRGLYPDPEYVSREAIKAWAWCEVNSQKRPRALRGWNRFFSGWLERGWERHRKSLPSSGVPLTDAEAKERALFEEGA